MDFRKRAYIVLMLDDILGIHNRDMLVELGKALEKSTSLVDHEALVQLFVDEVFTLQLLSTKYNEKIIFEAFHAMVDVIKNNYSPTTDSDVGNEVIKVLSQKINNINMYSQYLYD